MKFLHRAFLPHSLAIRLCFCLVLAFTVMGAAAGTARADGIITHTLVADKAMNGPGLDPELASLLKENADVVRYGAMFPDWLYAAAYIGNTPVNEAEMAHDVTASNEAYLAANGAHNGPVAVPEFRTALAAQLLPAFKSNSRSSYDEEALAFLFGVIAHQQADAPWHMQGNPTGYELWAAEQFPLAPKEWTSSLRQVVELYMDARLAKPEAGMAPVKFWVPQTEVLATYNVISPTNQLAAALPSAAMWEKGSHVALVTASAGLAGFEKPISALLRAVKWNAAADVVEPVERLLKVGVLTPWFEQISSNVDTYPTGGLVDGAANTVRGWQQMWNRMKAYTPVTTMATGQAKPDSGGWYHEPLSLALAPSVSDTFNGYLSYGPLATWYSLDGGKTYVPYTGPINFSTELVKQVSYYTVDVNGIKEQPHTQAVKIDMTPAVVPMCIDPLNYTRTGPGSGGNIITSVLPSNSWVKVYRIDGSNWFDVNPNGYGPIDANGYLKLDGMIVDPQYGTVGHPYRVELWANGQVIAAVGDTAAGQPAFRVFPYVDSYTPWSCPQ